MAVVRRVHFDSQVGFSRLANRMTMARTMKLYKLPDNTNSASELLQHSGELVSVFTVCVSRRLERNDSQPVHTAADTCAPNLLWVSFNVNNSV